MIGGENYLLVGAVLLIIAVFAGKVAYRFGAPALLLFLGVGMFFGYNFISFDSAEFAQVVGMIALCIILFSGGMDTRFSEIRPVMSPGVMLATVGVMLTAFIVAGFVWLVAPLLDISLTFPFALLLAATMSSTDSASVFSILRTKKQGLRENLRPLLELESGSNDPMAYMLTIALIQVIGSGTDFSVSSVATDILVQFAVGGVLGFLFGKFSVWLINKINLSNSSMYPILLLSLIFITFIITDMLKGNGYLAVYIAGVVVGNARLAFRKETDTFMNGLTWLVQIVMFLTLGLLVNPKEMLSIAPVALLIGLFMIVVARPVSVFACLLPFREISFRARTFVSWVGLRGAVPIIFATYPVVAEIPGADQIFNIVFFITLVSLIFQGMTIAKVARMLHLDLPEEKTGNEFGIELPDEIDSQLMDQTLTSEMLENGNRLMDMNIPKGTLVMIIKRGEKFIVPNGQLELKVGDKLLYIKEGAKE